MSFLFGGGPSAPPPPPPPPSAPQPAQPSIAEQGAAERQALAGAEGAGSDGTDVTGGRGVQAPQTTASPAASMNMSQVESPPTYAGDSMPSLATVTGNGGSVNIA